MTYFQVGSQQNMTVAILFIVLPAVLKSLLFEKSTSYNISYYLCKLHMTAVTYFWSKCSDLHYF